MPPAFAGALYTMLFRTFNNICTSALDAVSSCFGWLPSSKGRSSRRRIAGSGGMRNLDVLDRLGDHHCLIGLNHVSNQRPPLDFPTFLLDLALASEINVAKLKAGVVWLHDSHLR